MVTQLTIRVARAYLNISQAELAREIGCSVSLISAIENGTKRITPEFAQKFRRAVGMTDSVLIDIQYIQHKIAE